MSRNENIIFLDQGHHRPDEAKIEEILENLADVAETWFRPRVQEVISALDDALFSMAEKAVSTTEQTELFDAMREVRRKKTLICDAFLESLEKSHTDYAKTTASLEKNQDIEGSLSLLDEVELEQTLTVESMANKALNRCKSELPLYEHRIRWMLSLDEDSQHEYPLHPTYVAKAFVEATSALCLDRDARLVAHKIFDKKIIENIDSLFHIANTLLVHNQIFPKLDAKELLRKDWQNADANRPSSNSTTAQETAQGPVGANVAPAAASTMMHASVANPFATGSYTTVAQSIANDLQAFLSSTQSFDSSAVPHNAPSFSAPVHPGVAVQAASIIPMIAPLQQAISQGSGMSQLRDSLGDQNQRPSGSLNLMPILQSALSQQLQVAPSDIQFGPAESNLIDVVTLLFDFILQDPNLDDTIKMQLSRLQIPVFKAALIDKQILLNNRHAFRLLINEISRASVGCTNAQDAFSKSLHSEVEDIVQTIVDDFDEDMTLFDELLGNFKRFLHMYRKKAEAIEKRTQQTLKAKEKSDAAKRYVTNLLDELMGDQTLPDCVESLFTGPWLQYLYITALRHGEQSKNFESAHKVSQNLVNAFKWGTPESMFCETINDISTNLHSIHLTPHEVDRIKLDLLNTWQKQRVSRAKIAPLKTAVKKAQLDNSSTRDTATKEAAKTPSTTAPSNSNTQAQNAEPKNTFLDQLEVGTWFEFLPSNEEKIRGKLSAKLMQGKRIIFVNHMGMKLLERSAEELKAELDAGQCRTLDDSQLFDRALESVVCSLRELRH